MKNRMKKSLAFLLAFVMAFTVVGVQLPVTVEVEAATKIAFSCTAKTVAVGGTYTLVVQGVQDKKATYTWSSSNKKVATVSKNGVVKGVSEGSTTVKCKIIMSDESTKTLSCKVKVKEQKAATSVKISNAKLGTINAHTIVVGESYDFNRTLSPSNSNDKTYWYVLNEEYAEVDSNGVVTAKKEGITMLIARTGIDRVDAESKMNEIIDYIHLNLVAPKTKVTVTPKLTETPTVTSTPKPTPTPTVTPKPTSTPKPTPTVTLKPTTTPTPKVELSVISVGNDEIRLGTSVDNLIEEMDMPDDILPAEYANCEWYIYNADDTNLRIVLVQDEKVVGVYADSKDFTYKDITTHTTPEQLEVVGYREGYDSYEKTEENVKQIVFIDKLGDNTAEGILVMDVSVYQTFDIADRETTLERISFEVTNAFRAKNGLEYLEWCEKTAVIARAHCEDMIKNNFFAHDSFDGTDFSERLDNAGIYWWSCAENIAGGQRDGFYVTYGWINSSGHRRNILNEMVSRLGVGAVQGGYYRIYYTQDFYSPR